MEKPPLTLFLPLTSCTQISSRELFCSIQRIKFTIVDYGFGSVSVLLLESYATAKRILINQGLVYPDSVLLSISERCFYLHPNHHSLLSKKRPVSAPAAWWREHVQQGVLGPWRGHPEGRRIRCGRGDWRHALHRRGGAAVCWHWRVC